MPSIRRIGCSAGSSGAIVLVLTIVAGCIDTLPPASPETASLQPPTSDAAPTRTGLSCVANCSFPPLPAAAGALLSDCSFVHNLADVPEQAYAPEYPEGVSRANAVREYVAIDYMECASGLVGGLVAREVKFVAFYSVVENIEDNDSVTFAFFVFEWYTNSKELSSQAATLGMDLKVVDHMEMVVNERISGQIADYEVRVGAPERLFTVTGVLSLKHPLPFEEVSAYYRPLSNGTVGGYYWVPEGGSGQTHGCVMQFGESTYWSKRSQADAWECTNMPARFSSVEFVPIRTFSL